MSRSRYLRPVSLPGDKLADISNKLSRALLCQRCGPLVQFGIKIRDWHLIRRHLCSSLFERSQRIGHPRRAQHQHLCHNASHDEAQGGDFDRQLIKPSEVIRHGR